MQGFNMGRYVPPEHEGTTSANKLAGKHPLGKRGNKAGQGILTVRFEMPYPIWCTNCPKPTIIGQGVRFNAEKRKVGNYYTTPIFSFRMKHVPCSGWIEIRTDPKNTAYVVVEGARKRDTGEDKVAEGDVEVLTPEEREARRSNAFANLEGLVADRRQAAQAAQRIEELQAVQHKQWEDPYLRSQQLRKTFRVERQARERDAAATAALQDKMSLGIALLPASAEDAQRASFVQFGAAPGDDDGDGLEKTVARTVARPLFAADARTPAAAAAVARGSKLSRRQQDALRLAARKEELAAEIRGNTRAATDPFLLANRTEPREPLTLHGLKRKRAGAEASVDDKETAETAPKVLVDYDSD